MNDEEWHSKVEEHLLRDLIEDLQERVKEHDSILKGEKRSAGLLAEYVRHDELLRRMFAVIWQDPTGQKGLLHDVDALMGRQKDRQTDKQSRWQFWTAVTVALITSAAVLVTNWDAIKKSFPRDHPAELEQKIERARHPKSTKKIYRYRIHSATEKAETNMPPNQESSAPE